MASPIAGQSVTVLIVDDERTTREGLAANIPWGELGMEVIGLAADGRSALEMAADVHPDIVLTDVRMPRMDGIALAAAIRENDPDIEIVFLSGYTDREYLISAIKLRAFDYVEKPVSVDELTATLRKAREKVELRREELTASRRRLIQILLLGSDADEANRAIKASGPDTADFSVTTVMVVRSRRGIMVPDMRDVILDTVLSIRSVLAADFIGDDVVILVATDQAPNLSESSEAILDRIGSLWSDCERCTAGVGTAASSVSQMRESYDRALKAVGHAFYRGWGAVYAYRSGVNNASEDSVLDADAIHLCLENDQPNAALAILAERRDALRSAWGTPEGRVRDFYSRVLSTAEEVADRKRLDRGAGFCGGTLADIREAETLDEIHRIVCDTLTALFLPAAEFGRTRRLVYEVGRHIRLSRAAVPRLSEVAARFGISPSHLSRVFRIETGIRFTDYVKMQKAEQAKELLRDVTMRISEVADTLGYDDRRYFTRVFKHATGMSPREYRERHL